MTLMILSHPLTKHPIAFLNGLKTILLKSNADRCHLLVSTNYGVSMNVDEFKIDKSDTEKLLVLNFDRKLTFDDHIPDTCKKIGRGISFLARVTPYMSVAKKLILINAFFTLRFSCCPLVSMCHSRVNNNKINRLRERCLRIVYDNNQSLFIELLEINGSVSIHMRNI